MQLTIVDNSTLTAIQRLSGTAPTRSTKNTDGDIAALESFVQALLFSDLVCSVDDYKPAFRDSRRAEFPFVHPLDPPEIEMDVVARAVKRDVEALEREISDGNVKGELGRVLTSLGLLTQCAWEMSSSVFWLQFYLISNPEVGADQRVVSQLLTTLDDRSGSKDFFWDDDAKIDSDRYDGRPTSGFRALLAALSWVIARVRYYEAAAVHLPASVALHPVRHGYLQYRLYSDATVADHLKARVVDLLAQNTIKSLNTELSLEPGFLNLPLPFFTAWLASQRDDVPSMLQLALEIKTEPEFRAFRTCLREIECSPSGLRDAKGLVEDVGRVVDKFFNRYETPKISPTSSALIQLSEAGTKAPIGPVRNLLKAARLTIEERTSGLSLFRHLAHDLAAIPSWGALRDKLGSAVHLEERAVYEPKALSHEELNRVVYFRQPM